MEGQRMSRRDASLSQAAETDVTLFSPLRLMLAWKQYVFVFHPGAALVMYDYLHSEF